MMRNRSGSFVIAGAGALAIALAANGESTKVVSSYGPINQDVTFSQIKADLSDVNKKYRLTTIGITGSGSPDC